MKKYVLAVIGLSSCLASCAFEVNLGKDVKQCFDLGTLDDQGKCAIDEDKCNEELGGIYDGECNLNACLNYGGYLDDQNKCIFDSNDNTLCNNNSDNDSTSNNKDLPKCATIADCVNNGGFFDNECRKLNPLQAKLKVCQRSGKIEGATIHLENDIVIDANTFGNCDLINSDIIGKGDKKTVIKVANDTDKISNALFKNIKNSTIDNIELQYDVHYDGSTETAWTSDGTDDNTDGKGLLAHTITDSELSNIDINGNLTLQNIQYDEKNIGALAGVVSNTTLENINFAGKIDLATDENNTQNIKLYNVGGLIGLFFVNKYNHNDNASDNLDDDGKSSWVIKKVVVKTNDSHDDIIHINSNSPLAIENVGGLVGYVRRLTSNTTPRHFVENKVFGDIMINDEISDTKYNNQSIKYIGGQFGSIETNKDGDGDIRFSQISSSDFEGEIHIKTGTAYGVGGFVARAAGCALNDISAKKLINVTAISRSLDEKSTSKPSIQNYSIAQTGGLIGLIQKSSVQNPTIDMSIRLTGEYFNRIGGLAGSAWLTNFNSINNENIKKQININISNYCTQDCSTEMYLHDDQKPNTPSIGFLGGFVGKSFYGNYDTIEATLDLKLNLNGVSCEKTNSHKFIQYIGNAFGHSAIDTVNGIDGHYSCKNVTDRPELIIPESTRCSIETHVLYCEAPKASDTPENPENPDTP